jgi:hypothetical protein
MYRCLRLNARMTRTREREAAAMKDRPKPDRPQQPDKQRDKPTKREEVGDAGEDYIVKGEDERTRGE